MTPRLRQCGNPDCPICRWNDDEHMNSGHVEDDESLSSLLVGAAAIVIWIVAFLIVLPVLA